MKHWEASDYVGCVGVTLFFGLIMAMIYFMFFQFNIEKQRYAECRTLHVPIYMCDGHKIEIKGDVE